MCPSVRLIDDCSDSPNTESTGGRSPLLARILNFYSRALPDNSVRRAGSNFPQRSDPRLELRRGLGPNSVHSFFGSVDYPPGGGRIRSVEVRGWVEIFAACHLEDAHNRVISVATVSKAPPRFCRQLDYRNGAVSCDALCGSGAIDDW